MSNSPIPSWVGALLGALLYVIIMIFASAMQAEAPVVETTAPPTTQVVVETVESTTEPVDNSVNLVDNLVEEETTAPTEPPYTDEELEILAIIIYQEAGGDESSDDTRRKVGSVFLNRVASTYYPNTFIEVALQEAQYGELYWTGLKWPDRHTSPYEAEAVQRAYNIAEDLLMNGSILPSNVIYQAQFEQGDGVYCYQDGTYFCYKGVKQ